ncbi:hypothetical protein E2C01_019405 [Portunus trituberculatus]|uniref:Uncharacterized protein n=1 Tax=Portunus trituberculatus TaxID=210409 RepID=A0A5B7DYS8_PORTR|nr:hypothetical protein [Portunus trituberculatus]
MYVPPPPSLPLHDSTIPSTLHVYHSPFPLLFSPPPYTSPGASTPRPSRLRSRLPASRHLPTGDLVLRSLDVAQFNFWSTLGALVISKLNEPVRANAQAWFRRLDLGRDKSKCN